MLSRVFQVGSLRQLSTTAVRMQSSAPFINPNILQAATGAKSNDSAQTLRAIFDQKATESRKRIDLISKTNIIQETPKEDAFGARLTGVKAGRTVDVHRNDTAAAFRQLNTVIFANRVAHDRRAQRYHMKPGKAKEAKRSQRHRKEFMKGFKRLIEIVKDAKRKGY